MKCLSVRQPWASLIVLGAKDVENRTWRTSYRGPLLIHASQRVEPHDAAYLAAAMRAEGLDWPDVLQTGGVVGVATLTDCVTEDDSEWFDGPVGWILEDARPVPFFQLTGRLGLFEVPDDILPAAVRHLLETPRAEAPAPA